MKNLYETTPQTEEEPVVETPTEGETTEPEVEVTEEHTPINCDGFDVKSMKTNYMFGISLVDQQGNEFPESLLASYLNGAISWAEALFDICLTKQEVNGENHDYERNDYMNWGFLQLWKRPVREVKSVKLMYGTQPSFEVPNDWIKLDKKAGKIQMFPAQGSANHMIISQSGIVFGLQQRWGYAPQMWEVDYVAGMEENDIPEHLKILIYKKATIDILTVWGDLIIGAGIANQSISIDGLSQSIGTTQSAMYGGASARCQQYKDDINDLIPVLRMQFDSPRMVVL